jgi:hypothetical protein
MDGIFSNGSKGVNGPLSIRGGMGDIRRFKVFQGRLRLSNQ